MINVIKVLLVIFLSFAPKLIYLMNIRMEVDPIKWHFNLQMQNTIQIGAVGKITIITALH